VAGRRTTRAGPRGTRGPGGQRSSRARVATSSANRPTPRAERPVFTGRAAILLLVLAVLAVSYASSMRAYLQQRAHIEALRAEIAETGQDIEALEREKRRWQDDAYVEMQARERFGYVMPGETGYQVIDENGRPLDSPDRLSDPDEVAPAVPTAWWEVAWSSVELAGDPEKYGGRPEHKIEAPAE